jgi:hypothetical protein
MTEKARKILKRLNNPDARERFLSDFNASTLDDVGPVGGDQSMAVLKEMNELEAGHDDFVKSLAPRVDGV